MGNKKTGQHSSIQFIKKVLLLTLLFILPSYGAIKYAPIIMDDIITFVPYSEVHVSLGGDKILGEDQVQTLSASISNVDQVVSYSWTEGSTVLSTGSTFSTASLSLGTHSITLTVTDSNGLKASDTVVITIEDALDESEYIFDSIVGTTKGEFSVNQGTANYSLKIDVPPGVAGMEPKLSLNYSSGSGNGYMGVGWSIGGVSAITRCSQSRAVDGDNHKFGVTYNRNDRFCLDGQRLILVSGAYGTDGAVYRTEIDSYSKIIAHSNSNGAGDPWFEVKTKSGLTYRYGHANDAAQKTITNGVTKFWKVSSIKDSFDNAINFFYHSTPSTGEHYITAVTYADNSVKFDYEVRDDVLKGYHAANPFRVSKRLNTVTVKNGSTSIRHYAITYRNDATGRKQSKLSSITEYAGNDALKKLHVLWNSTDLAYRFMYVFSSNTNIAVNGTNNYPYIYTPDMNGDGLSDICYRDDTGLKCFINNKGTFSSAAEIDTGICSDSHSGCSSHNNWDTIRFVDMDADGLADLVYRSDTGIRIWKSTGSGLSLLASNTILSGDLPNGSDNNWKYLYTPDTNGDGLADICYRADDGMKCYVNQGDGVFDDTNPPDINTSICANGSQEDGICDNEDNWDTIRFVDMDADGLQDLVYRSDEGMRIWKSYGHGFGFRPSHSSTLIKNSYQDLGIATVLKDESKYIYTPDMNGDGLPDLCYRSYEGIKCYRNYGGKFGTVATIDSTICANDSTEDGTCNDADNYQTIRFVDTDADGLVDLTYRSDAGMRVWKNIGNTLADSPKESIILANYQDSFGYNDKDNWSTKGYFDVNGDGIQDLYYRSDTGIVVYKNTSLQSYVTKFTNLTDQNIQISYKPMTDASVYHNYSTHGHRNEYGFNNIANDNIEITSAMPVVSSFTTLNGTGDDINDFSGYNTISYKYEGYVVNKHRGVQGFHAIHTYDDATKMLSVTKYKQVTDTNGTGFEYTGMPYELYSGIIYTSVEDALLSENLSLGTSVNWLSDTSVSYENAANATSKVYEPYTSKTVQQFYDPGSSNVIKTTTHENTLSTNGYGDITKTIDTIKDGVSGTSSIKTTDNTYATPNTDKWYIGRLSSASVTHQIGTRSSIERSSSFTYDAETGVLVKEIANEGSTLELTKAYTYDSHGNKATETISGSGITTAKTIYTYDEATLGKFQTSVKDAAGYSITKTYDARFGTVKSLTDANGLTTSWDYDGLGRKIKETRADGTSTTWSHVWASEHNLYAIPHALYSVGVSTRGAPFSRTYYDSLGRDVGSYTYSMDKGDRDSMASRCVIKHQTYNDRGELKKEELPHYQGETAGLIETTYDKYGRATSVTKTGPNNTDQVYTTSYNKFTQTLTNPNNQTKITVKNAFGEVKSINDGATISYTYDSTGNLLSTTDSAGNVISMEYDDVGNKKKMNDPDLGIWTYTYNELGKMTAQSNVLNQETKIEYDVLGRITSKKVTQGTNMHEVTYLYGSKNAQAGSRGKLLKTTATSSMNGGADKVQTITYTYNGKGYISQTSTKITGSEDYVTKISYDHHSRPSRTTYPNGYYVTNRYKNGLLDAVIGKEGKVHYEVNERNAFGEMEKAKFANGINTGIDYDTAGYIKNINSYGVPFGNIQSLHYEYDGLGNVKKRNEININGKFINETFEYDSMNRLTKFDVDTDVQVRGFALTKTYDYDAIGNMIFQTGIGDYDYNNTSYGPHAVNSAGTRAYKYDEVGNMTDRNGDLISYNPLNKPSTLTNHLNNKTVTFTYGAGGQRYQKQTSDGILTYYIGKMYEEQTEDNTEKQTCYITLGGKTIGTHVEVKDTDYVTNNPHYNEATYNRYFHTDALGSITAITDDAGTVVERRSYEPFGKIRAMDYGTNNNTLANTTIQTTRAFTGHEQIAELSGLVHMNARIYDSDIGRFLSADTVIQDPHDSQSYNRYSYVRNNPLKYTDPTGNSWWTKFRDKWLKPIVSIVISAVIIAATMGYGALASTWVGGLNAVQAGALVGGISGGIMTGSLTGAVKGAIFGAISAGVANGIGNIGESMASSWGASAAKAGRALLHGLSRAAITRAQGGKFSAGFWSGFAGSALSGISAQANTFSGKLIIQSVVGGTASELGGGKFANGAVSAAFVMMFNDWLHDASNLAAGFGDTVSFGLTSAFRETYGYDSVIDYDSGLYLGGEVATIGLGGARLVYAGIAKSLSISGMSARQAFEYRNLLKKVFRLNPFSKYRIYKYDDMLLKYGETGLKAAAGRTYQPLNYLGGASFFGGFIKPFE